MIGQVFNNTDQGRVYKIVNFLTPGARELLLGRVYIGDILKCIISLILLYFWARFRQTKCLIMMTKKGSAKIVNFMTPWVEVLMF